MSLSETISVKTGLKLLHSHVKDSLSVVSDENWCDDLTHSGLTNMQTEKIRKGQREPRSRQWQNPTFLPPLFSQIEPQMVRTDV